MWKNTEQENEISKLYAVCLNLLNFRTRREKMKTPLTYFSRLYAFENLPR